jgi:hypothetical protein
VIIPEETPPKFADRGPQLPRLQLMYRYQTLFTREGAFAAMSAPGFNPREQIVLERPPNPAPGQPDPSASVRLVEETTDSLTIEAHLNQPAILFVADAWYNGWRVVALKLGPQRRYDIIPADYAFRAVPLAAGEHLFRMEYAPAAFGIGVAVSAVSAMAFLGVAAWLFIRRRRAAVQPAEREASLKGSLPW